MANGHRLNTKAGPMGPCTLKCCRPWGSLSKTKRLYNRILRRKSRQDLRTEDTT